MAKTLIDFRAEKGLYLKDVAEKTGIPEDELRAVEESGTVPPQIAEIIINDYHLTDTYFSVEEIGKLTPQNPTKYFLKVTIIYTILETLVVSVPMLVAFVNTSLKTFTPSGNGLPFMDSSVYTIFTSLWGVVVAILSCILFADYILKRTTFKGDIKKYQFLHNSIPNGTIAFVSMLIAFMTTMGAKGGDINNTYFIWQFLSGIISWVAIGLIIAIQVKLLKTAIEPDVSKKQNVLKTFAIIATISSVLAFALNVVSQIILNEFSIMLLVRRFFVYGLDVAVIWAVALVNPDDEKKCKFAYTILPLIAISQSFVFTLISL